MFYSTPRASCNFKVDEFGKQLAAMSARPRVISLPLSSLSLPSPLLPFPPLPSPLVLPKFEVTLEGPEQLTRDDDFISGTVSAR